MKRQTSILPALLASLLVVSCATKETDRDLFIQADTDKDGRLSLMEVNRMGLPRLFARYDLDGDGSATWEEVIQVDPGFDKKRFDERDLNRDGKVRFSEYEAFVTRRGGLKPWFDEIDTNQDGFISNAEAEAFVARGRAGNNQDGV